jgi:hypothetical protein
LKETERAFYTGLALMAVPAIVAWFTPKMGVFPLAFIGLLVSMGALVSCL